MNCGYLESDVKQLNCELNTKVTRLWVVKTITYIVYPLVVMKLITLEQLIEFSTKFLKIDTKLVDKI